jgi:hypothetical protein
VINESVSSASKPTSSPPIGAGFIVAIAALAVLTLASIWFSNGNIGVALAPTLGVAVLYAIWKVPLRYTLFVLMFAAFTLENPADRFACDRWHSPIAIVGALMLTHINNTLGVRALSFSGMDVMFVILIFCALARHLVNSNIDTRGRISVPKPLVQLAFLALGGMIYVWVSGLLRGGNFSMSLWQVDRVMYIPIVFLLFQIALRGPQDYVALMRVLLAAACARAMLAVYIVRTVTPPPPKPGEEPGLAYATTHHDTMLFAGAFVLVLALLIERAGGKKAKWLALAVLPILSAGIIANNRRLAWVQVAIVMATLYFVKPWTGLKLKVTKNLLKIAPLAAIYFVVGWGQKGGFFKPVQILRSLVDSKTDDSTLWRDIENFDLVSTVQQFPFLGTGYGHPYLEVIPLPAVDYPLEFFIPHNSLIGLWAYCGFFGFTALTLIFAGGVYFTMRGYYAAERPEDRAAAVTALGAIVIYLVQVYGDVGLGAWAGVFTVAPALALGGKIAVATGGWPSKGARGDRATVPKKVVVDASPLPSS